MWFRTEIGPAWIGDLNGLVLPGPATSTLDQLRSAQVALRRQELLALWARAASRLPEVQEDLSVLQTLLARIDYDTAHALLNVPLLANHLRGPEASAEELGRKAAGALRFLLGHSAFAAIDAQPDLVERLLGPGPAYLPHSHVVYDVHAGGRTTVQPGLRVEHLRVLNGVAGVRTRDPSAPWPCEGPRQRLAEGLGLLAQVWPQARANVEAWYQSVLMLDDPGGGRYLSFTSEDLPGAYIATAKMAAQVCDSMVHEASHARLAVARRWDPLIEDDGAEIHPSPWRPDPRPMLGIVAGVHAFINVHHFYARLRACTAEPSLVELSTRKLADSEKKLSVAWSYARPRVRPTALGAQFIDEMDAYTRTL